VEVLFHLEPLVISLLMTLLKVDPSLIASQKASNVDLIASCPTIQSPPESDFDLKC
jgi:hypothetical protein